MIKNPYFINGSECKERLPDAENDDMVLSDIFDILANAKMHIEDFKRQGALAVDTQPAAPWTNTLDKVITKLEDSMDNIVDHRALATDYIKAHDKTTSDVCPNCGLQEDTVSLRATRKDLVKAEGIARSLINPITKHFGII